MKYLTTTLFIFFTIAVLAQDKYTFVFLRIRPEAEKITKEESDRIMKGHMANIQKMAADGHLLAAGPFQGGGGLFIFNGSSTEDIKQWMSPDPGVQAKRWNIEMLPYEPKIGGICPIKTETYEMVQYTFIHFRPKIQKFNLQQASATVAEHDKFVKDISKDGNVVTHASFGGLDGAILIMKGDVQEEAILADPAVTAALFEPEFKKLYIAKGSFCEQ